MAGSFESECGNRVDRCEREVSAGVGGAAERTRVSANHRPGFLKTKTMPPRARIGSSVLTRNSCHSRITRISEP